MSNWWLSRQSNNDRARAKAGRRTSGRAGSRSASRKSSAIRRSIDGRAMALEQMEDRLLLTSGPQLISIIPNDGSLLLPNETVSNNPTQLTFRFLLAAGETIAPNSLTGIQLTRSGGDGAFGNANDVSITPGYVGIDPAHPNQVQMRFSSPLPDDLYQITIVGAGNGALTDQAKVPFNGGVNYVQDFRLQLGPQVLSVVPQPVSRDPAGVLTPHNNEIDVYFNEPVQTLKGDATHLNAGQFELLYTNNTANASDDQRYTPSSVSYDAFNNEAKLIFANNLDSLGGVSGDTAGALRLRIGNTDTPVTTPLTIPGTTAATNGTFLNATELPGSPVGGLANPLPATQQTVIFNGNIQQQSDLNGLVFPGGLADPGHRNIPLGENHVGGIYAGVEGATISYGFPSNYGSDPNTGQPLFNQITANQEQTVREVFQLYSYYTGLNFIEQPGGGDINIAVGDVRTVQKDIPPTIGGISGGSKIVINGNINWGASLYGSGFMSVAMHEIGHSLGLPHDDDGPPDTVMNGGAETVQAGGGAQGLFPGIADITNLQFTHEPTSNQIDLYKFTVDSSGTLNAQTTAQRLASVSQLNTLITLYEEFNDLNLPASGAQVTSGDTFTITATNTDGTAGTPVTFEFTQVSGDPTQVPAGTVLPGGHIEVPFNAASTQQDLAVTIVSEIQSQKMNVSATIGTGSVQLAGPLTVTASGTSLSISQARTMVSRNDDYYGTDSFASLAVQPGIYYAAVTSSGNDQFDPNVAYSGWGGNTLGRYQLSLNFQPTSLKPLTDPGLSLLVPASPVTGAGSIPNGYSFTLTDVNQGTGQPVVETVTFYNGATAPANSAGHINVQVAPTDTQDSLATKLVTALNSAIADGNFNASNYTLTNIGNGRVEVGGAASTSIVVDPSGNLAASAAAPLVLWGTTARDSLVGNAGPGGTGEFNFWFNAGPTVYVDKAAASGGNGTAAAPYNTIQAALSNPAVTGAPATGQEVNVRVEPNAHATLAIAASQNGIAVGQTFQVAAGPYKFTFEFVATGTNGAQLPDSNFAVVIGSAPNPASANVSLAIYSALNTATLTLPTGRQIQLAAADGGGVTVTQGIDGTASSYSDGNYYYVYLFQGAQPLTVAAQTTPFSKLIAGVTPPAINNNNAAYLVGTDQFGNLLPDDSPANSILQMPKNTVLMIDAGSVFKLRQANIEVGSSAVNIDQSQSALQVLGVPGAQTVFTSYDDDTATLGAPLIHPGATKAPGDWGGLVFNNDSDLETLGSFLNSVNEATITYGGGRVVVNGVPSNYDSIYLSTARPAITNDVIINGAGAAISCNPDSFESTLFGSDLTIAVNRLPANGDQFTLGTVQFQFTTNGVVAPGYTGISIAGMTTTTQVAGALKAAINQYVLTTTNPSGASTLIDQAQSLGSLVTLPDNITVNGASLTSPTTIGGLTFAPDSYSTDYQRFGPDVHGNLLTTGPGKAVAVSNPNNANQQIGLTYPGLAQDTINGILVRINTNAGQSLDTLDVSAVFAATDIPYVLQENLVVSGNTGGNLRVNGVPVARIAGQLLVEPGVLIKLGGSRIETQSGANVIAEGTAAQPIVFTSINDARYGGGGTFDTANSGATVAPKAGDWAGLYFWPTARGSFDQTLITFGGGSSAIEGGFANFDAIEIHQAKVRIADSVLENNASGADGSNRNGRMFNDAATIFVLGAQPSIVNNVIQNNQGAAISTDVDSLDSNQVPDWGRSTGPLARFTQFDSNDGPLVRLNQVGGNGINGMVVRGGMLETSSVWDDTDVVHVVEGTVTVPNFASVGGLRIESSATQSLVIKMERGAGFDASGSPGDISDRIGGEIQILGTPNHPVIITSVNDDTVGAGLTPNSQADNDTNGDGAATQPTPGDWNSVLLDQYSNDRNVAMIEQTTAGATPATAQSIGQLAPNQQSGDDNLRLGFQVNGYLNTPQAINTYTFKGTAGTQAFLSVTNTSPALDAVLELVDANGNVLARSDQADAEQQDANLNGDPMQAGPLLTSDLPGSIAQPLQDSTIGVPGLGLENFWSTNLKDPGFRVTLPGPAGVNNYYVRVYAKGAGDPPPTTNTSGGLPAPTANSATPSTTGGGMLSATYYYEVTATTATGETTASGQQSATVSGPTGSVNLSWNPVAGATGYKIYRSTEPFGSLGINQYYDLVAVVAGGTVGSYVDTGTNLTYLPDTATPGAASHGLVGGQYELQVRLQQMVEVPGSTVQNADIRFATNGIDVEGLPAHSPLIANTSVASGVSTTTPATGNQGTAVPAQNIGDLITSDTSSLNAAGNLAGLDSVQWYTFNLTYAQIQVIGGGQKTWSTVFDVGYADGLTRPDTEVDVYDSAGNLIYVGRDSNVADQQPPPTPGTSLGGDAGLLSHSSFGQNDPYIGPVQMETGNPGAPQTYYVAVHSSSVLPSAIDATFNAAATDYLVRLEPVDSMTRVVEDHIGTAGGGTAQDPATLTPLFGNTTGTPAKTNPAGDFTVANDGSKITTAGYQQLNSYATPYNLSDVVLYVSAPDPQDGGSTHLYTFNPFTGAIQTDQGKISPQSGPGNLGMNAIAMRNDGQLYGMQTGISDGSTNLVQVNTGTPGQSTVAGNAAISTFYINPSNGNYGGANAGVQFDAMAFVQSDGNNKISVANGNSNRLLFAVGHRDPTNSNRVSPTDNLLYELNADNGNSEGFVLSQTGPGIWENPLPSDSTIFTTDPIVFVTDATIPNNPANDVVDATWWGPAVQGKSAYQRLDGTFVDMPPATNTAAISAPLQGMPAASTKAGKLAVGTYYYEITATNAAGQTIASNEQSAVIPGAPAPNGISASATGGTLSDGTYTYVVTALTAAGETPVSVSDEQSVAVTGPTGEVTVNWAAVPNATGYNVYRTSGPSQTEKLVQTVAAGATNFVDTGTVTTAQTPSFTLAGEVTLNWAPVPGATGYNVYRGDTGSGSEGLLKANTGTLNLATGNYRFTDDGSFAPALPAPPKANTALLAAPAGVTLAQPANTPALYGSLTTGTYHYVVTAVTSAGETKPSAEQSLSVTGPNGRVQITWNEVAGATGYKIYRTNPNAAAGSENYMVGEVPAGTASFVDTFNSPTRVTVTPSPGVPTTFEMDSGPEIDFFTNPNTPGGSGSTVANGGGSIMTSAAAFRNGETFQLLDPVTGNVKTFYFQNSGAVLPFYAPDGISQGDATTIHEHETFTVTGSKGTATFEFVYTGDPVTPGNVAVLVSLGQSLDGIMQDISTAITNSGINVTATQPQPGDNRLQLVGLQAFVNNAPSEFPYGLAQIAVAPFGEVPIPFLESDSLATLETAIATAVNTAFAGDITVDVSSDGSRMAFLSPNSGSVLPSPSPGVPASTALTAGMVDPANDPGSTGQPTGFTYVQGSDNGVAVPGDVRVPFHMNDVADTLEPPPLPAGANSIDQELADAINKRFPGTVSATTVSNNTLTAFGVELKGTIGNGDSATLPFYTQGANGKGGNITGLASIGANLYAVTDRGDLYLVQYNTPAPGVPGYNSNGAKLQFIKNIVDPGSGQSIAFHGLASGPPDVDNGAYANDLFATSESGVLYAFDPTTVTAVGLLPVFHNPADANAYQRDRSIQLAGGVAGSPVLDNNISLAFSTLDYNLWHVTNTNADANQGINVSADQSRNPLSPNKPPAAGDSMYFGLEAHSDTANTPQNALPVDSEYYSTATYNTGNTAPYNTYNVPGGAYGSMTTNTFSLSGYNAGQKPTLYFDYYLDAGGNYSIKNTAPAPFSSARVFVSPDGGNTWQLVATNDTVLAAPPAPAIDATTQMPSYISTSENTGSGDARQQVQPLWDSVANSSTWRQARIDLSKYAGDTNLELRFDFSTSGTTYNPSSPGNYAQGKDNTGAGIDSLAFDNSFGANYDNGMQPSARAGIGQNLNHAGWYVDNIIVGFAGKGEMVTNASKLAGAANTGYFAVPPNPDPNRVRPIPSGPYELEIRRGAEYGSTISDQKPDIGLGGTFSVNDRLDSSYSLNTDFSQTPQPVVAAGSASWNFSNLAPTTDGQGIVSLSLTAQMTADAKLPTNLNVPSVFKVTIPQLSGGNAFSQTITLNTPATGQPQGQSVSARYTLSAAQMAILTGLPSFNLVVTQVSNVDTDQIGIVSAEATLDYMPFAEHQQFMIDDGKNRQTFEFVRSGDATTPGNKPIIYNVGFTTPQDMASAIITAIDGGIVNGTFSPGVYNPTTFNVSASLSGRGDNNSTGVIYLFGAQNIINGGPFANLYGMTYGSIGLLDSAYFGPGSLSNQDTFVVRYDPAFLSDQFTSNFGDTTMPRPQGAVILSGNQVSNSQNSGILVESSPRGQLVGPTVIFSGGGGSGATGTAVVSGGQVVGITITSGGSGYTSPPTVSVSGGGTGAILGTAVISNGAVTSVPVLAGGASYANGDNIQGLPHQGAVVNTPTLNSDLLVPGVTIINNLIYGVSATGSGITFAGDPDLGNTVAAVPFGRIVNNTIYGGYTSTDANGVTTPVGIGINVAKNASPTMLNNILANLQTGIQLDNSSKNQVSPPVLGENIYQNNTSNFNVSPGTFAIQLQPKDPLFINPTTDPGTANFYLQESSQAIDSSINSLQDRAEMTAVTGPLAIAPSPIIAPSVDLYGQLRVPDPNVSPFPGLGNNVFIDRGAIERVDNPSVGLTAALLSPIDNGATDRNPAANVVFIRGQSLSEFTVQFSDGTGPGVYDASVLAKRLEIVEDGRLLTAGTDYFFDYDNNNHIIHLVAASGVWLNGHQYDIYLSNGNNGGSFDPFNASSKPGPITDRAGNNLQANEPSGLTHFRLLLAYDENSPPVLNMPTGAQVDQAYDAALNPASPIPAAGSIYEGTSVTFSQALGDPITIYDVDANGGKETVTLTANTGILTLSPDGIASLQSISGAMYEYLDGSGNQVAGPTGTLVITAPLGDLKSVPVAPGLVTALDGLTFTPGPYFNSDLAGGQNAILTITVNDDNNTPPPARQTTTAVSLHVIAVNNPPSNDLPAAVAGTTAAAPLNVGEDVPVVFASTAPSGSVAVGQVSVSDPDVPPGSPFYNNTNQAPYEEIISLAPANAGKLSLGTVPAGINFLNGSSNNSATLDFAGTLSAINQAIAGLVFTETRDFPGALAITFTTNDGGNLGLGPAPTYAAPPQPLSDTKTIFINVVPDNDAPVLDTTDAVSFPTIAEDAGSGFPGEPADAGSSVLSMLQSAAPTVANIITLAAPGAKYGIAITSATPAVGGTWQYSLGAGGNWVNFPAVSASKALLLDGADWVRFLPDPEFSGTGASSPSITFQAWDETYDAFSQTNDVHGTTISLNSDPSKGAGTGGSWPFSIGSTTATLAVTPDNDAPVLATSAVHFAAIPEDAGSGFPGEPANLGSTVLSMLQSAAGGGNVISLAAAGAKYGIAVTGADTTNGAWQYQLSGSGTWTTIAPAAGKAVLLDGADLVRFLPKPEFSGTGASAPSLSFVAWDETYDAFTKAADAHGTTVTLNSDPTKGAGSGGSWPFSTASSTATIDVTADNDAPLLDNSHPLSFASIPEDAGGPIPGDPADIGSSVLSMLQSAAPAVANVMTLQAGGAKYGIGVTSVNTMNGGVWQYSLNGGAKWLNFPSAITAPTGLAALVLDGADLVRFLPTDEFTGTGAGAPSLSFLAWDQTYNLATSGSDAPGTLVTNVLQGNSAPFSLTSATATLEVTPVVDAPQLTSSGAVFFAQINEDVADTNNGGSSVVAMLASAGGNIDQLNAPGAKYGIAVTQVTQYANGNWQFSIDGGKTWTTFDPLLNAPATPGSSALLLDGADLVRFRPTTPNFNSTAANPVWGATPSLSFVAWDETDDPIASRTDTNGKYVDLTMAGGTGGSTPFSLLSNPATASLTVKAVDDAPVVTTSTTTFQTAETLDASDGSQTITIKGVSVSDVDAREAAGGAPTETLTVSVPAAAGTISLGGRTASSVTVTDTLFNLNNDLAGLTFRPALESALVSPVTLAISISDLGNFGSLPNGVSALTASGAVTITITPTHHAPILLADPAAQTILENVPSATNRGASLDSLLTTSVASFDSDAGAVSGIAVTGTSVTPTLAGKWQYSTDGGGSWTDISANVSPTNALLLPGTDLLRFNPATGTAGVANLAFHAWDQTSGQAGGTANLTAAGATGEGTAFSVAEMSATWNVQLVNQPPTFTLAASANTLENNTIVASGGSQGGSNAGLIVVPGFASNISPGQPVEAQPPYSQLVTFQVTNNNNALFSLQPYIVGTDPNDPAKLAHPQLQPGDLIYMLQPDVFGTATLTVSAKDNDTTDPGNNQSGVYSPAPTINVGLINDPPTIASVGDQTVLEDSAASTISLSGITAGLNEAGQSVTITATSDNPALLPNPTIAYDGTAPAAATGTLTFQPAKFHSGTAHVTITVKDNAGTANGGVDSFTETFTVTVTPVNHAPSFKKGNDQTVNEDTGAHTVTGWATNISPGPDPVEASQQLNFIVTTNNDSLFTVAPAIDPATGTLTYTLAPDISGAATVSVVLHDNGGTDNGGVDTSAPQKFQVNVQFVNDAPSFTIGTAPPVLENSGKQSVNFASNISPDEHPTPAANEASQTVHFVVVGDDNPTLFAVGPAISPTGVLTYQPAPDSSGTANITVELQDNAGTANGGVDTSTTVTFPIVVRLVDDPPTFTFQHGSQVVNEDSGSHVVTNWATQISPGVGANEASQHVNFIVTNDNPALFAPGGQPTLVINGTNANLQYTLASTPPVEFGAANVTVTLKDDGDTTYGGSNTSLPANFQIYVNQVNHPPFLANPVTPPVVNENTGPFTIPSSVLSKVFDDYDLPFGDHLTLSLVSNDNPGLVDAVLSGGDAATAALTFDFVHDQFGVANIDLRATDQAGKTVDDTFSVTVNHVNQPPSFTIGPDVRVNENAGAQSIAGWATGISAGPGNESGQSLNFFVTGNSNPALFSVAPAVDGSTGTLSFTPAPGAFGTATLSLLLQDNGGTANGGQDTTSVQTFNIRVIAPPSAQPDSYVLSVGTTSSATAADGVLANDSDPNGDPLTATIVSQPTNGTVTFRADGSFTYTKGTSFAGIDSFTYQVHNESNASGPITVSIISYEATIVKKLYEQVLNRDPDTAGLEYWTTKIQQGQPYSVIAQGIFESNERLDPIITQYYQQFLFRQPDELGLSYWRDQVWKKFGGPEHVIEGMISSPEFFKSAGGTNTGWVTALYERLLKREPDQQGLGYWVNALDNQTMTEANVVTGFLSSKEYYSNLVTGFFEEYLLRQPSSSELSTYVAQMLAGSTQRDIQDELINTDEYRNSPPPPNPGTVRILPA